MTERHVDEELEPGLRYTEEFSRTVRSFSMGDYLLWKEQAGSRAYVGGLNVVFFRQRIGAVAVPSAGIGGVETVPAYRRQGYAHKLLTRALQSLAARVPVVYLSEAILGLYERYGFCTCWADSSLEIEVRNVEHFGAEPTLSVRSFAKADLPPATLGAMIELYNQVHAARSLTHERQATWNQLHYTELWTPGSEVVCVGKDGRLGGYAILQEQPFGQTTTPFEAYELAARDVQCAHALLAEIAARCWDLRISSFRVREPLDSSAGRAAQQIGCTVRQVYRASGGMMGAILNRKALLALLEPELRRRAAGAEWGAEEAAAFAALVRGEALPDHGVLLRLLVGHGSWADAVALGIQVPDRYRCPFEAWFPGGGTQALPQPYAHALDSY